MAQARRDIDHTLAALADPKRRLVIDLLVDGPRKASDLAAATDTQRPAMSKHLRALLESGLIEEAVSDHQDRRTRVYQLRREPFASLQIWLDDVHGFWTDQLAAFKAHVESTSQTEQR